MGKLFLIIGLAGLCHAAYSATQHRNYLRLTEHEFSTLPLDIILQTLLSLLSCCFGIISIASQFKPIKITSEWENKIWDNIANRTSFYSFNHRGKYLFSSDDNVSSETKQLVEAQLKKQELIEEQQRRKKLTLIREKKEREQQQRLLLEQQQRSQKEEEYSEEESETGERHSSSENSEQEN